MTDQTDASPMTNAPAPVPPDEYEYPGDDPGTPLRSMDCARIVSRELQISETTYFRSLHLVVEARMKRRFGPDNPTKTILKSELFALINDWKYTGF